MTRFTGSVRMAGEIGQGVSVQIHLGDETLTLSARDGSELGTWPLANVGINSKPDGFHLHVEGEEIVLSTEDDARFALEIGIATPNNRLARQMARLRDERSAAQVLVDLTDDPATSVPPADVSLALPVSRRSTRLSTGLPYLGPLVVLAATLSFVCSIVALASGPSITFPANLPAWPAMTAASLFMAAGGFAAYQNPLQGRAPIAGSIALGLVTILLTAGRLVDEGLAGQALFGFALAVVTSGVLLAVDTAGRPAPD